MRHDEFIGQVQDRARLSSRGEVEGATARPWEPRRTHTGTACHRTGIPAADRDRRASAAHGHQGWAGTAERFDRDVFVARVAQRGRTTAPPAVYQVRVVLEVVGEATTGGVVAKVREALPDDLCALIDAGSSGQLD